jgi:hypothetical protein
MTMCAGTGSTSRRAGAVHHPIRDGDEVRLEPRPLPDLLMHYLLRKAKGSELAAKYEVDHQLRFCGPERHAAPDAALVTAGVRTA